MSELVEARAVIVDYGMGNLFSIRHACQQVGLRPEVSSDPKTVAEADAVVLPGIGAFGDAMATLRRLDLVEPILDVVAAGKPLMGVCLGLQLLFTESHEFGVHRGLGLIEGTVEHLGQPRRGDRTLKVPHIGWNAVRSTGRSWSGSGLEGVPDGEPMYFVHSYHVRPSDPTVVLSLSRYGDVEFCSSVQVGTLFACQFHPERSGRIGLAVYKNLKAAVIRASAPLSL